MIEVELIYNVSFFLVYGKVDSVIFFFIFLSTMVYYCQGTQGPLEARKGKRTDFLLSSKKEHKPVDTFDFRLVKPILDLTFRTIR